MWLANTFGRLTSALTSEMADNTSNRDATAKNCDRQLLMGVSLGKVLFGKDGRTITVVRG
jgi:hypothetical protein